MSPLYFPSPRQNFFFGLYEFFLHGRTFYCPFFRPSWTLILADFSTTATTLDSTFDTLPRPRPTSTILLRRHSPTTTHPFETHPPTHQNADVVERHPAGADAGGVCRHHPVVDTAAAADADPCRFQDLAYPGVLHSQSQVHCRGFLREADVDHHDVSPSGRSASVP